MPTSTSPAKEAGTTFLWQGRNREGVERSGEVTARNLALAKALLRRDGIEPRRLRRKPRRLFAARKPKVTGTDIALFTRQLATMLKAGLPLVPSFEIVATSLENPTLAEVVRALCDEVASGVSLSDALRRHPHHFGELYCNLVAAGEAAGTLDAILEHLAIHLEKQDALRGKIRKAMNYPIAVVVVAVVVTGVLLVKVIPQFAGTFADFGAELPAPTLFVMGLSDLAIAYWRQALALIAVVIGLGRVALARSPACRRWLDWAVLRLPVVGPLQRHSCCARFTRTLATTFGAGLPLVNALESVAGTVGNGEYTAALRQVREQVIGGRPLAEAMANAKLFPPMVTRMVAVGEESGTLDDMLAKCATFYEAQVDDGVDGLTSLLEPLIMAVLGVVLGGLMIAMYLPVFQLGAVM